MIIIILVELRLKSGFDSQTKVTHKNELSNSCISILHISEQKMIIINHLELRLKSGLLSFRFASFRSEVSEKTASSFNAKSDLKVFVGQCLRKWAKLEGKVKGGY